jgi:hypothetical protein
MNFIINDSCVLSLGSRHSVGPRNLSPKTRQKVCVWCVFDILSPLDQTLCLEPMAGHSIWGRLIIQKPHIQHNYKLDDLRAGFEIAKGDWIGHVAEVNFQHAIGQGG